MNIFMTKIRGARVQVNLYVFILTSVTLACALESLVWFPDPSTHIIRACAYNACACEKEGSGTELYPNAGQRWNVRKGVRMQLWI